MNTKIMNIANVCFNFNFSQLLKKPQVVEGFDDVIMEAFKRAIDEASSQQISIVLLTGKLFDEETLLVYEIDEIIEMLAKNQDLQFIIAPDVVDEESSWYSIVNWPKNVTVLNRGDDHVRLDDDELIIFRGKLDESLKETTFRKICVKSSYEEERNEDEANLFLAYDQSNFKADDNTYCPGTFLPYSFGQSMHGYLLFNLSDNSVTHDFMINEDYKLIRKNIVLDASMDMDQIVNLTQDAINDETNHYYDLEYTGVINNSIQGNLAASIKEAISKVAYINIINNTRKNYDVQSIKTANLDNLIGLFIEEVQDEDISENEKSKIIEYGLDYLL